MKYEYLSQYSKDIAFDAFLNELNYVIKVGALILLLFS